MNFALTLKILGTFWILLAGAMLVPLAVAFYYGDGDAGVFWLSFAVTFIPGSSFFLLFRKSEGRFIHRETFMLVTLVWFSISIFGAAPFYFSGSYSTFSDAFFEAASGFTTTGASVIGDVESLSHAILFWRSLTHWIGGMGIIVLSLAILPLLGVGGMELFKAETTGPTSDKISARVSETARALWVVYVFLTCVQIIILWALGMSLFDAVNHSFATLATGGFSTKNISIAAYNSEAIDWVITFFMFISGMNFILHYRLLVRREKEALLDRELRFYFVVVCSAIFLVTVYLWGRSYEDIFEALRYASFQVVSIVTTTGFVTADFEQWGPFPQLILLLLMLLGGCAGSTAGGIKCVRAMMLIKQGYRELYRMIHPRAVFPLKLGQATVPSNVASAIFGFFFLYVLVITITALFITATGVDLITAISGTLSCISNVGPGLNEVGPMFNYGHLPSVAKILLGACMIIGRLEVFTVLVVLTAEYWRS